MGVTQAAIDAVDAGLANMGLLSDAVDSGSSLLGKVGAFFGSHPKTAVAATLAGASVVAVPATEAVTGKSITNVPADVAGAVASGIGQAGGEAAGGAGAGFGAGLVKGATNALKQAAGPTAPAQPGSGPSLSTFLMLGALLAVVLLVARA